jgi:hypothetical protein
MPLFHLSQFLENLPEKQIQFPHDLPFKINKNGVKLDLDLFDDFELIIVVRFAPCKSKAENIALLVYAKRLNFLVKRCF